jgi:hypothetical protein
MRTRYILTALLSLATAFLLATAFWLRANRVWVIVQTSDQRDLCSALVRAGTPDDAEQYQTVVKF